MSRRCERCPDPATIEVFMGGPGPEPGFDYYCDHCYEDYKDEQRIRAARQKRVLRITAAMILSAATLILAIVQFLDTNTTTPARGKMPDENTARPRHRLANLARPLCVIDSEWTNASQAEARIVSLAIHKLLPDGTIEEHEWFVNPEKQIDPGSQAVHGISNEQAAAWPPFRDIAGEVAALLEDADIGGYSVSQDVQILERELDAAGIVLQTGGFRIVDGLRLWQMRERRKLTDAYQRFVGPIPEQIHAHDAGDDVRMTIAVIEALAGSATVDELHVEGNATMVDVAGKFVRDERGRIVFGFGRHRGAPIEEHHDFLRWMLNRDFPRSTLDIAIAEINRPIEPDTITDDTITDDVPF